MEKLTNFKPNGILDITIKTSAKGNNYITLVITEMSIEKEYDNDNLALLVKISEFLDKYTIDYQVQQNDLKEKNKIKF